MPKKQKKKTKKKLKKEDESTEDSETTEEIEALKNLKLPDDETDNEWEFYIEIASPDRAICSSYFYFFFFLTFLPFPGPIFFMRWFILFSSLLYLFLKLK